MQLFINTDGGSRGNPGESGVGVVVTDETGSVLHQISYYLGQGTNNEAEYQAVIQSLAWLLNANLKPTQITWRLDSKLVVEQLSRRWKIKESRLQTLATECWQSLAKLAIPYQFIYVPRAENAQADALANQAMDRGAN